jgi:hypothetical protein
MFAGKQRKAIRAELDTLRTVHTERQTAHAAAAALVRPEQQVPLPDLSPERTEEIAAALMERAARTDAATLRVRQNGLAQYTAQLEKSVEPLEQINAELDARAKDPSLSVPDDPQVLAQEAAQQQLHARARTYDRDITPRHDRGISM